MTRSLLLLSALLAPLTARAGDGHAFQAGGFVAAYDAPVRTWLASPALGYEHEWGDRGVRGALGLASAPLARFEGWGLAGGPLAVGHAGVWFGGDHVRGGPLVSLGLVDWGFGGKLIVMPGQWGLELRNQVALTGLETWLSVRFEPRPARPDPGR